MRVIWLPLLASVGTMALLYWIGNIFNLSLLRFSFVLNEPLKNGLIFDANIAILPFVFGLLVGFIVERIVKVRSK
ncbi:ATPase [Thalassobacillus sp. CUG 92003]|uniref:ATPase n=1 Tax=Thalassobacillus sp. CUG 92003 TaxID=2736641 RepID=UPI0015E78D4C|nr:ATPase [Thalassobacillus sp. CUG 92003]